MISAKKIIIAIILAVIVFFTFNIVNGGGKDTDSSSGIKTYTAVKRDMSVNVVENGTIESVDAYVVKSQVEGSTTIISIIPEGEVVTQEDIDNKRILVELDSSGLREKISQQEITYNSAMSSLTEATESLDIQRNQNDSDVQKGRLTVQFALMDLQKYLGEELAENVVEEDIYEKNPIEMLKLIGHENIGGEALQKKRELSSSIDLKIEDLERAKYDLFWTEQLAEKDYVAASDLKADELKVKRLDVDVERAQTNLDLFQRYEFIKQARKLLSDYNEAQRELERTEARSRSRLAQSEAKLRSQQATFNLQKERFEKLQAQIEACIIYAEVPGMVVYASNANRWGSSRTNIDVGEAVRERQEILTIPDNSRMAVNIKIHESSIDKVKRGQKASIKIDAKPDADYTGTITKIAPLPDPQNFLANPDMKVYSTEVTIDGEITDIRPGMSAKVDILIKKLNDVIAVPLQCVASRGGERVCYVLRDGKPVQQSVSTGAYNDSFVEITSGLEVEDRVLLTLPKLYEADRRDSGKARQASDIEDIEQADPKLEPVETPAAAEPGAKRRPAGNPQRNPGRTP
jgi:HlyD family secretion protein